MANAGAGDIENLLGGMLFDRIGEFKSIMAGIIVSILALLDSYFGLLFRRLPVSSRPKGGTVFTRES